MGQTFVKSYTTSGGKRVRGYIRVRGNGPMNMRQFNTAYRPRVPSTSLESQMAVSNSKRLKRMSLSVQGRRRFKADMLRQKTLRNRKGY